MLIKLIYDNSIAYQLIEKNYSSMDDQSPGNPSTKNINVDKNVKRKLRHESEVKFVGNPELLTERTIPSTRDVYLHFRQEMLILTDRGEKKSKRNKSGHKSPGLLTAAAHNTIEVLEKIWKKGPYLTISKQAITKKILNAHEKPQALQKNSSRNSPAEAKKREDFKVLLDTTFDIAAEGWRLDCLKTRDRESAEVDIKFLEKRLAGENVTFSGNVA